MEFRRIDDMTYYYYDTQSKLPLNKMFEKGKLSKAQMKEILQSIVATVKEAKKYLLSEEYFWLSPEKVFCNATADNTYLCYIPGEKSDLKEGLLRIVEFFMDQADYSDQEAVMFIYEFYRKCRNDFFP